MRQNDFHTENDYSLCIRTEENQPKLFLDAKTIDSKIKEEVLSFIHFEEKVRIFVKANANSVIFVVLLSMTPASD